ncbi:MAG: diaminopimelate epimerase [Acidobacteria bacterium RIFCSPLOWO2_12_FULL_59_11]|nr:MAG: diaminopimelate epimerase [Acidobacteria bacterium RIFCSPLOWO2_12_FULL_59_11]
MIRTPFTKAQGVGNDFLIVALPAEAAALSPAWVRRICDRRLGVGADGVLVVSVPARAPEADAVVKIFNSDGSEAEISGNGTRCAAAYLVQAGCCGAQVSIRTGAGQKRLTLLSREENRFVFEMAMGAPVFSAAAIPFSPSSPVPEPPEPAEKPLEKIVGFDLPLSGGPRKVTVTSMGNPHCSLAVEHFDWDWEALGAEIEKHPFFPRRANVEFYRLLSRREIEVRFWERGVGMTLSSGTGSCAAAVAAILNRQAESPVTVKTLAGELRVRWESEGVFLTGPAEIICQGEFFSPEEFSSAKPP